MKTEFLTRARACYSGKIYPVLVAALILIGYATGLEVFFSVGMLATVVVGFLICQDIRFMITPLFCTIFSVNATHSPNVPNYSDYYTQAWVIVTLAVTAVLLIGGLIFFLIHNRKSAQPLPQKGMLPGLLVFCVAVCANGLFSANYTVGNLLYAGTFLLAGALVYWIFARHVKFDRDTPDYLMYCLTVAGLLICAQLLITYLTTVRFDINGDVIKESVIVGWGVWTTVGGMLAFLMPACFYFVATRKHGWIGYLLGLLELFCILLSQSRGALVVGGGVFVLCVLGTCLGGAYRKRNRWIALGVLAFGGLGVCLLWGKILPLIQNFLNAGFGDNGRYDLWRIGWSNFLQNPIFGSGFYDSYVNQEWTLNVIPYMYHNTVIQFLGATGIVGSAAYAYHRLCTLRLVIRRPTVYKTFLAFCIVGLLIFSLLDVLLFNIYPLFYYALMLLFMDRSNGMTTAKSA